MSEAGKGERAQPQPPRIYVASLSDYNAGRLHGCWLDASQEPSALADGVQAMLARSPEPFAEEYAIHDYEGFGPLQLSEYESLERVAHLGRGIREHGEAFAAWAGLGTDNDLSVERFEDVYRGTWASLDEYAEDLLADFGVDSYLDSVPEWVRPYVRIDSAALGRDLRLSGDIAAVDGQDGIHIFEVER